MPTYSRVRRKRGPAIGWVPTQDSHYQLAKILRSATDATPLYLTQSAILDFEAHVRDNSSPLPFGLLAGHVCLCPQTQLEYLLINVVARARIELTEDDPYTQLADELRSLILQQANHQKLAIGWYLGGLADDLALDIEAAEVHRALFPERWQIALMHGEMYGTERGALLRFESTWNRWYSIPFFEEYSPAGRKDGERRSAFRWANYGTDEPVAPLDELEGSEQKANGASRSWWGSRDFRAFLQPRRRAARATPPPSPEPSPGRASAAGAPAASAPAASATAASAPARYALPSAPKTATAPVAAALAPRRPADAPRAAATAPLARPEPLGVALPAQRVPEPTHVAAPERTESTSAVEIDAPSAGEVDRALEAPSSDVQQVFIDGRLVPIPLAQALAEQTGWRERAIGVRISSLLIGALAVALLFVLYLIAS